MKKLMIALGVVAMAAISAQAARINWSVDGVTAHDTLTTEGYYMACFCLQADAGTGKYTTLEEAKKWANSKGESGTVVKLSEAYIDSEGTGMNSNPYTGMTSTWKSSQATAKYGDFYAVIFNAEDMADATAYMVTSVENLKFSTTASTLQTAALSAGTWTDISSGGVPEPTSAMLLLLGVAGLALKRKVA